MNLAAITKQDLQQMGIENEDNLSNFFHDLAIEIITSNKIDYDGVCDIVYEITEIVKSKVK